MDNLNEGLNLPKKGGLEQAKVGDYLLCYNYYTVEELMSFGGNITEKIEFTVGKKYQIKSIGKNSILAGYEVIDDYGNSFRLPLSGKSSWFGGYDSGDFFRLIPLKLSEGLNLPKKIDKRGITRVVYKQAVDGKMKNVPVIDPNRAWEKREYNDNESTMYYSNSVGGHEKHVLDQYGNVLYWENLNTGEYSKYEYGRNYEKTEDHTGYWEKTYYNESGDEVYYENSDGEQWGTMPEPLNEGLNLVKQNWYAENILKQFEIIYIILRKDPDKYGKDMAISYGLNDDQTNCYFSVYGVSLYNSQFSIIINWNMSKPLELEFTFETVMGVTKKYTNTISLQELRKYSDIFIDENVFSNLDFLPEACIKYIMSVLKEF